jgi:hypothetical protein
MLSYEKDGEDLPDEFTRIALLRTAYLTATGTIIDGTEA